MSVALAEQPPEMLQPFPEVIYVPALPTEELSRRRAERLFRTAGELAIVATVEDYDLPKQGYKNLHDALIAAARGEQEAEKMIAANVSTDIFERTIKAGFVMSSRLEMDESGQILQHGQTNEQIQANTLFHCAANTKMLPRYQAEARNAYRLDAVRREGWLEDYCFVVISLCADDMTDEELADNDFFVPTKSMAVQATTQNDEVIFMESAFLAGVKTEDSERHDKEMISAFGNRIGVNLTGSAAEIIDRAFLVPKTMMPNGVINLVELLDDVTGGTFFGQDKPGQDYLQFAESCQKRYQEMQPKVKEIIAELKARVEEVDSPIKATNLLNKVVGKHMVEVAVKDERIDPRVFGEQAAWHITDARAHLAIGDLERARMMTQKAVEVETSSSCPGGAKRSSEALDGIEGITEKDVTSVKKEDKSGDCDFVSKECPLCHTKNVKTTVKNGEYIGACGCSSKTGKRHKSSDHPIAAKVIPLFSDNSKKLSKEAA